MTIFDAFWAIFGTFLETFFLFLRIPHPISLAHGSPSDERKGHGGLLTFGVQRDSFHFLCGYRVTEHVSCAFSFQVVFLEITSNLPRGFSEEEKTMLDTRMGRTVSCSNAFFVCEQCRWTKRNLYQKRYLDN